MSCPGEDLVVVVRVRPAEAGALAPPRPQTDRPRGRRERRGQLADPEVEREAEPRRVRRGVDDLGSKRVIQVRFNMSVPRARVPEKASMLRDRFER